MLSSPEFTNLTKILSAPFLLVGTEIEDAHQRGLKSPLVLMMGRVSVPV